ncbi:MAG: TlpA family protein disulfide reductase [Actinobacteria bacterium]|nr:TlpA family protein disulfide reductase [Actinomycetota bacterium]
MRPDSRAPSSPPPGPQAGPVRAFLFIGAGLLALALLGWLVQPRSRGPGEIGVADFRAQARVEERPAPPFELPALDGPGSIALDDFAGRVIVLNFWASWCGPCRAEAPELERTWEAYREEGVQFLGIDYRDDRAAAQAFQREFGITYPSVYDPGGALAFDYGLLGVPTTFVIDRDGLVRYRFTGRIDRTILSGALDDVLGEGE